MKKSIRIALVGVGALMVVLSLYLVPSAISRFGLFMVSVIGLIIALVGIVYPSENKSEELSGDSGSSA